MSVSLVDSISIEKSPFVTSKTTVYTFCDTPVISLTEYHYVCAIIDPFDWENGVAASEDAVGAECRNALGERGKQVPNGLPLMAYSYVVEVSVEVVRGSFLIVLQSPPTLVLSIYQQ